MDAVQISLKLFKDDVNYKVTDDVKVTFKSRTKFEIINNTVSRKQVFGLCKTTFIIFNANRRG